MARIAKSVDLQELNLPSVVVNEVKAALLKPYGLIILAGPTNSGKSTTIAGIVGEHVKMYGDTKKRISLEEPVERYLEGITQVTVQHGNFAELIRALLRHDPDMVWVGEIRDAFSAGACVRASTSGHITMSTVHANNSVLAVRAIANYLQGKGDGEMSSGASLFDLAESVSLIIAQRLVKQLCPNCKEAYRPSEAEIETVARYLDGENQNALATTLRAFRQDSNARMYRAPRKNDCPHCQGSGFKGERPICEALPVNRKVRALMSSDESRLPVDEISTFRVNTLSDHAFELVKTGLIELSSMIV
jgi:type II secretory ATPase GspE/PulE/Tfp pilus assembly ATPase PilB-like protein